MEVWKPINDYEDYYEVSNYGRFKSLKRGIILHPYKQKDGYLLIDLFKDGVRNTKLAHRVVAETFIDNPNNLPCVNHKDEIKDNNNVANLEWCDYSYNNSYGSKTERIRTTKKEKYKDVDDRYHGYKIVAYDYNGNMIGYYTSILEASKQLGINRTTISEALRLRDGKTTKYDFRRTF